MNIASMAKQNMKRKLEMGTGGFRILRGCKDFHRLNWRSEKLTNEEATKVYPIGTDLN